MKDKLSQAEQDNADLGQQLQDSHEHLHPRNDTNAPQVDQHEQPHERQSRQRRQPWVTVQSRNKNGQVAHDADRNNGIRDPGSDPIAPQYGEGNALAESALRIGIWPLVQRKGARQAGEDDGEEHATEDRDQPGGQCVQPIGRQRRRHDENANSDGIAHDQRYTCPEAEHTGRVGRCLHDARAPHVCASASVIAASSSSMASSTCVRSIISGGTNRTVLKPQESSSSPL